MNEILKVPYLKRVSGGLQEHILERDGDVLPSPNVKRALGFWRETDPV